MVCWVLLYQYPADYSGFHYVLGTAEAPLLAAEECCAGKSAEKKLNEIRESLKFKKTGGWAP